MSDDLFRYISDHKILVVRPAAEGTWQVVETSAKTNIEVVLAVVIDRELASRIFRDEVAKDMRPWELEGWTR